MQHLGVARIGDRQRADQLARDGLVAARAGAKGAMSK